MRIYTSVTFKEISIEDTASLMLKKVGHKGNPDVAYENIQAWSRKNVELAVSAKEGGIVLGTGDLSELWLGFTTMFGDHASHYNVNAGVPKTLVSKLIQWSINNLFSENEGVQRVLLDILDTPVTPELLPSKGKGINHKTEKIVGPYELHDFFGYWMLRFGFTPTKILRLGYEAFEDRYEYGEIRKWLEVFIRRFFASQFKRSVMPDGPKVGSLSASPRDEWKMPSDVPNPDIWLKDLFQTPKNL